MPQRLKSNLKYVWMNLLHCVTFVLMLYGGIVVLPGVWEVGKPGEVALVLIWILLALGGLVGFLLNFLLKWQWVTVGTEEIWVRCVLFEIKRIPKSNIKLCWVCRKCLVVSLPRMSNIYRDCIVIDTGISRRRHQVQDGFCRKKQKYIIFRDTTENRLALRECGIVVENP